jgi:predicted amidophosphoribosyltransferase
MVRPLDNKVCLKCGERLPMIGRYCPHCGKQKSPQSEWTPLHTFAVIAGIITALVLGRVLWG